MMDAWTRVVLSTLSAPISMQDEELECSGCFPSPPVSIVSISETDCFGIPSRNMNFIMYVHLTRNITKYEKCMKTVYESHIISILLKMVHIYKQKSA